MTTFPRITIITPSYNQAGYLESTICSVLDQDYPNLEYFVVDGGSTDGSRDILKAYDRELTGWVSEKDGGQTEAINKGIAKATGDIIAFINSDDLYNFGALDHVAAIMSGDDAPKWVVGGCTQIDFAGKYIGSFDVKAPATFAQYLMRTDGLLTQPSSFWHRSLFEKHGTFATDLHFSFDYEFNCRLLAGGEAPYLTREPLAAFRFHGESKSMTQAVGFGLERIEIAKRYAHHLSLRDRAKLHRQLGYRQRRYAIDQAKASGSKAVWPLVMRKPWWIASQQVREALAEGRKAKAA